MALTVVLVVAAAVLWWLSRTVVMLPSPVDERPLEVVRTDGRLLFAATLCAAAALVAGTRAVLELREGSLQARGVNGGSAAAGEVT